MRLMREVHLKAGLAFIITIVIISSKPAQQVILIVPPGPRMMRTLWINSRERIENFQKRKDGGGSYPEGLEILLKETAERNRPTSETVDSPENAPQDHDIRQSERVLEFQNRDFWKRQTDLSWHYPILVTLREMPFKNYRGTSSEKSKVRDNKIEEVRKWRTSSWSWL